jgi:hypothetical protein
MKEDRHGQSPSLDYRQQAPRPLSSAMASQMAEETLSILARPEDEVTHHNIARLEAVVTHLNTACQ